MKKSLIVTMVITAAMCFSPDAGGVSAGETGTLNMQMNGKISVALNHFLQEEGGAVDPIRVIIRLRSKTPHLENDVPPTGSGGPVLQNLRNDVDQGYRAVSEFLKNLKQERRSAFRMDDEDAPATAESPVDLHPYWIANSLGATLTPREIFKLASHPDVLEVDENTVLSVPPVVANSIDLDSLDGDLWNFSIIGMDDIGDTLDGKGVRIGHLDTGVDTIHPDLAGKLINWAEFDPYGRFIDSSPHESHYLGHGTHTASIILGNNTGIAPGATLLSALVLPAGSGTTEQVLAGMEWVLDPDNDPATDDGAKIVNMSWGMSASSSVLRSAVQNMAEAGVLSVCAIGNEGSYITYSPGNFPESVGVGAVDEDNNVPYFSGGGVVWWDNLVNIKPDITAPGVHVVGIGNDGEYQTLSGTSFAAPHVTGAAAILLQMNPRLSPSQVKKFLYNTAVDLGASGMDIEYGRGVLNAAQAVKFLAGYANRIHTADLVIKRTSESVSLPYSLYETYFSDGQGHFLTDEVVNFYTFADGEGSQTRIFGFADVNGDDYADLVIQQSLALAPDEYKVNYLVYPSAEAGGLSSSFSSWYSFLSPSPEPYELVGFADLNGDHNTDLVLSSVESTYSGQRIHITALLSNGVNGFTFSTADWQTLFSDQYHSVTVKLGDVNGDEKGDLVFAKYFNDAYATYPVDYFVCLSNGTVFEAARPWITLYSNSINGRPEFLAVTDVTGDGADDLVLASNSSYWLSNTKDISVCPSNRSSQFIGKELWATIPWDQTRSLVPLEDVNGDGLKDVIISGTDEAASKWFVEPWLSNGQNSFVAAGTSWLDVAQPSAELVPRIIGVANVGLGDWSDR